MKATTIFWKGTIARTTGHPERGDSYQRRDRWADEDFITRKGVLLPTAGWAARLVPIFNETDHDPEDIEMIKEGLRVLLSNVSIEKTVHAGLLIRPSGMVMVVGCSPAPRLEFLPVLPNSIYFDASSVDKDPEIDAAIEICTSIEDLVEMILLTENFPRERVEIQPVSHYVNLWKASKYGGENSKLVAEPVKEKSTAKNPIRPSLSKA